MPCVGMACNMAGIACCLAGTTQTTAKRHWPMFLWNGFSKRTFARGMREATMHGFAQIGLRQTCRGGVDGCERLRQLTPCRMKTGVHHGAPHEAPAYFTANAQTRAHSQGFLLRRVETEKTQRAGV